MVQPGKTQQTQAKSARQEQLKADYDKTNYDKTVQTRAEQLKIEQAKAKQEMQEQADAGFAWLPAPAKINLFLHVVGQRSDGYHCLQSVFQFVDLYDYLSFRRRDDGQIRLHMPQMPELANEHNLIYRAAKLLQAQTKPRQPEGLPGVDIWCHKYLPIGSGLGGGSSNAATTLIALNRLWGLQLSRVALQQLGLQLGADVPVFIYGRPAFAQGVGEQLSAVDRMAGAVLLVLPAITVSTASVFTAPNLTKDTKAITIDDFIGWQTSVGAAIDTLNTRVGGAANVGQPNIDPHTMQVGLFGHNDLQPVAQKLHPQLAALLQHLNAMGVGGTVSGSGGSVFALFATAQAANRQLEHFYAKMLDVQAKHNLGVDAQVCNTLAQHPLFTWLDYNQTIGD